MEEEKERREVERFGVSPKLHRFFLFCGFWREKKVQTLLEVLDVATGEGNADAVRGGLSLDLLLNSGLLSDLGGHLVSFFFLL